MKLITHDGTFHSDEVFAYVILSDLFSDRNPSLVRTRDPAVIDAPGDRIIFDVGSVYDPGARRYDHHMKDKPCREDGTPYSSVGLVWRHHGLAWLADRYDLDGGILAEAFEKIDRSSIFPIDRADNGVGTVGSDSIVSLIDALNLNWNDKNRASDARFMEAASFARTALHAVADKIVSAELAAEKVREAARNADDRRIVVLTLSMPWESAIIRGGFDEALYVVYPKENGEWYCSAIPPEIGSFAQRLPLPAEWGGLRNTSLADASGVADAVFCHPGLFVCGAASRDGAIALAGESIRLGHLPKCRPV